MALSDKDFLEANAHISDEEVIQDIRDTNTEIRDLLQQRSRMSGYDRFSNMKLRKISADIDERRKFSKDLYRLLDLRGVKIT